MRLQRFGLGTVLAGVAGDAISLFFRDRRKSARPDSTDLEDRALAGGAFYINQVERDLSNGRLSFALMAHPDRPVVVRTLTFHGVQDFREEWDEDEEEDPDFIQQIIGLRQTRHGQGSNFFIRLDRSIMSFYSEAEPRIGNASFRLMS